MSPQSLLWVGQLVSDQHQELHVSLGWTLVQYCYDTTVMTIIQAKFYMAAFQEYENEHFFLEVGGSNNC